MTKTTVAEQRTAAAADEVAALHRAELQLTDELRAARKALDDAEDVAGLDTFAAAVDNREVEADGDAVTAAAARVKACERAADMARERRAEAILAYYMVQAEELRARDAELRAEVIDRQKIAAEFLADLEALEGCKYAPAPIGHLANTTQAVPGTTRTQNMMVEADALEAQARDLERRQVQHNGTATGASVEEVLENAAADPFIVAPPLDVLERKARDLVEGERRRRAKLDKLRDGWVEPDAPMSLELVWVNGVLVERQCSCATAPAVLA